MLMCCMILEKRSYSFQDFGFGILILLLIGIGSLNLFLERVLNYRNSTNT